MIVERYDQSILIFARVLEIVQKSNIIDSVQGYRLQSGIQKFDFQGQPPYMMSVRFPKFDKIHPFFAVGVVTAEVRFDALVAVVLDAGVEFAIQLFAPVAAFSDKLTAAAADGYKNEKDFQFHRFSFQEKKIANNLIKIMLRRTIINLRLHYRPLK